MKKCVATVIGRRLTGQRLFDGGSELFFGPGSTDKQLLASSVTERDGLPSVLRRYGDADLNFAPGVTHRADHAGDNGTDFRIGTQQSFEHILHAVDDGMLDLELPLRRTLSERGHFSHCNTRRYNEL